MSNDSLGNEDMLVKWIYTCEYSLSHAVCRCENKFLQPAFSLTYCHSPLVLDGFSTFKWIIQKIKINYEKLCTDFCGYKISDQLLWNCSSISCPDLQEWKQWPVVFTRKKNHTLVLKTTSKEERIFFSLLMVHKNEEKCSGKIIFKKLYSAKDINPWHSFF